jgi:chromosome segregation ATPase
MNFYDLFEFKDTKGEYIKKKDSEEHQDITIADPKTALALKQARNKYSFANTDVEALLKMQQDDQEKDESDLDKLERDTERQERAIQKNKELVQSLRDKEAQAEKNISALELQTKEQDNVITQLRSQLADVTGIAGEYANIVKGLGNDLNDLESRLQGVKTAAGEFQPKSRQVKAPEIDDVPAGLQNAYRRVIR